MNETNRPNQLLLCDDEVHILRAAEFKFKRAGYIVRCACDGQEGWEQIEQQLPDLVITDLQMPRLDGFGLVERIRQHEHTRHLPVIMLTAKGYELQHAVADQRGIVRILAKPFSPRELLQLVEETLETQNAERGTQNSALA